MFTLKVEHTCVIDDSYVFDGKTINRGYIQKTGEQSFFEADSIKVRKIESRKELELLEKESHEDSDSEEKYKRRLELAEKGFFHTRLDCRNIEFLLPNTVRKEKGKYAELRDIEVGIYYEACLTTKKKNSDKLEEPKFVLFSEGFLMNSDGKTIDKF